MAKAMGIENGKDKIVINADSMISKVRLSKSALRRDEVVKVAFTLKDLNKIGDDRLDSFILLLRRI